MPQCVECGVLLGDKRSALRHWRENHAGEIWTPEEYLGGFESEQYDFDGEEPDPSKHNPRYEVVNERVETKEAKLDDYEPE